ncbi:hypothetical protein BV25DRAFT_231125 [Artomyces pyxidatus]|uniref:Uncharacterized protein n=1 Tax=Artomyces pyxidatus TaxID=48021 RepID=A0ACB8SFR0_9AGAM|nr:hypothetical protein BV25DRAFT_231125 [Artomyces pyxidatus]
MLSHTSLSWTFWCVTFSGTGCCGPSRLEVVLRERRGGPLMVRYYHFDNNVLNERTSRLLTCVGRSLSEPQSLHPTEPRIHFDLMPTKYKRRLTTPFCHERTSNLSSYAVSGRRSFHSIHRGFLSPLKGLSSYFDANRRQAGLVLARTI